MRKAFVSALLEEARVDSSIILITGDLGYGILDIFQKELPNQFINAGVAEQSMMSMAAGIASTGKKVFVYSIANFPTLRCLEQIRNDICLMNLPVVVVAVGAGYSYGSQGYTHHALEDIAVMRALPNMEIIVPADSEDTKIITKLVIDRKSPSYLRLGRDNEPIIHRELPNIQFGKINELYSGKNGTLLFCGPIGGIALQARTHLANSGIEVAVASVPFVSDLDLNYLKAASKIGPIVSIEEHSHRGGLGSSILETLSINSISADVRILASMQKNISQIGSQEFLRAENGLTVDRIVKIFN